MKGYPKWFSKKLIQGLFWALCSSGFILIPSMINTRLEWDVIWKLPSQLRINIAALHALLSYLFSILLGVLFPIHIRLEWRKKRKRNTGVSILIAIAFLIISGIGIYYISNDLLSLYSSLIHASIGLILMVIFLLHLC